MKFCFEIIIIWAGHGLSFTMAISVSDDSCTVMGKQSSFRWVEESYLADVRKQPDLDLKRPDPGPGRKKPGKTTKNNQKTTKKQQRQTKNCPKI